MDRTALFVTFYTIAALFVLGAIRLAGRADEATDQTLGDWPDTSGLGGLFHEVRDSKGGQQDHGC